jgi:hypothetical protein
MRRPVLLCARFLATPIVPPEIAIGARSPGRISPEETKGDQEEGWPKEEMSRFLPYENGGAFKRAGV